MTMHKRLRSILLPTTAFSLAIVAACASLGTPEDQESAGSLWQEMEGHRQWGFFDGHVGMQKGHGPHGDYVVTYINDLAQSNQASPPFGSILVKENYGSEDESSLDSYTVMKRIEGYDPENGDWFWARFSSKGKLTHSGKVSMCSDCHFDAGDDDFVFLND